MTMKFATIAIQDFASITLIGRVGHGAGCEALDGDGHPYLLGEIPRFKSFTRGLTI
jgi:hypothetical protein